MFCAQCGTLVSANSRFCVACGTRVTDPGAGSRPGTLALTQPAEEQLLASVRRALAAEYDVERELGRGGMAVVFKARDKELDRTVALKVLPLELTPVATVAERFKREARLAASLDHPHIIPVYRVGQAGGVLYMAMKFIDGRPLDSLVASHGPLPLPAALTVLRAAASALAYAHEHGIVHRDIKGANILIDRQGRVVVTDFGIARAVESATLTATGTVIGTPHFMSPEQCAGKAVGPQSDQYSLGIVAYQLLTGSVPFDGDSLPEILQHHWFTPAPDVSLVRPDIPAALTAVVLRLMAKDPADRFASSNDLVASLDSIPFKAVDQAGGRATLAALAAGTGAIAPEKGEHPKGERRDDGAAAAGAAEKVEPQKVESRENSARSPTTVRSAPPVPAPVTVRDEGQNTESERGQAPAKPGGTVRLPVGSATGANAIRQPIGTPPRKRAPRRSPGVLIAAVVVLGIVATGFVLKATRAAIGNSTSDVILASATGSLHCSVAPRLDAPLTREAGGRAYQAGDYELARRFFVRAVLADPKDAAGQRELGCDYLKLGEPTAPPSISIARRWGRSRIAADPGHRGRRTRRPNRG